MSIRWKLYISSLMPLFILLVIQNMNLKQFYCSLCVLLNLIASKSWNVIFSKNNLTSNHFFWLIVLIMLCVSICFSKELFKLVSKEKGVLKYRENKFFNDKFGKDKLEINTVDILNYIFTYLIPLMSLDINDYRTIIVNVFLLYIIGYIYNKNNEISMNIVFLFKDINVYSVNSEYQIITDLTRKEILQMGPKIVNILYNTSEITEDIFIVKKIEKK